LNHPPLSEPLNIRPSINLFRPRGSLREKRLLYRRSSILLPRRRE
jgi:hypothetical protein